MTIPVPYWLLEGGVRLYSRTVSAMKSFTLQADTSYGVEVNVVARLGGIPVRGVKVKIKVADGEEDLGASDAKGEYKDAGGNTKRQATTGARLEIVATYENKAEQLRKEHVTVTLSELDAEAKKGKSRAKHEIAKIRDAPTDADDVDFKCEYDASEDLAWVDVDGARILKVTLKLCTLSLLVPYVNQRGANDTVSTRPGLSRGKDPETIAHDVRTPKGGSFSGDVLCYPTSVTMVLRYWGQQKTRREVMQECYDQWANTGFAGRKDKSAGEPTATAPDKPKEDQYWLDSSPGDAAGFTLKRAVFDIAWEPLSGTDHTATTTGKEAPKKPKAGDIWKDTSAAPAVFKKAVEQFDSWAAVDEEDWRVDAGGAKVWQFGSWATKALDALKPSGAGYSATFAPAPLYTYKDATTKKSKTIDVAPLSKIVDGDQDLTKVNDDVKILDKYKEWLKNGWPFIIPTTATDGHMMVARGAVVDEKEEIAWIIVNDPYGNLEGDGASYSKEERNTKSGEGSEKGKNAYYRNETLGKDSRLRIKLGGRGFPRIEKTISAEWIGTRVVPGE